MKQLDAIPIHEHIGRYEEIRREGTRYTGSHRHQSQGGRCLQIYTETNSWYCHHCHIGGSILQYEANRLNASNETAYQSLAEQYNLNLQPAEIAHITERKEVSDLILQIMKWYHSQVHRVMDYLIDRGFTPETIDQYLIGYAPENHNKLASRIKDCSVEKLLETGLYLPDTKRDGKVIPLYRKRIVFPYHHMGRIAFSIGRTLDPNDKRKYVKHLRKEYVNQQSIENVLWQEDKIKPGSKLIVAEGIIDALLLQQYSPSDTIISPVTTQWSNEQIERLATATLEANSINFIADSEENNAGEKGVVRTANKLIAAWGNPEPDDMPELLITRLRRDKPSGKKDVADLIKEGNVKELDYWLDSAVSIDYEIMRRHKNQRRVFSGPRKGFRARQPMNEILLHPNHFVMLGDMLHRYTGGYYQVDNGRLQADVNAMMRHDADVRYSKQVFDLLKENPLMAPEVDDPDPYVLNVQNGLYNVRTGELIPHTPKHLSTQRINASVGVYSKDDMATVVNFLGEVLENDAHSLVHEIIGYCLFNDSRFEKAFMLLGTGATGKSTLLRMIQELVGIDNVSHTSLQQLDTDRFAPSLLAGKLVNIFSDLPSKAIEDSSAFKMLTSGERISAQHKYGKQFFFVPKATLLFSANEFPSSWDKTEGFKRRWEIVDMNRVVPPEKRDPFLIDKLTTDGCKSALLHLAISGLNQLLKNGRFSTPESSRKLRDETWEENDSTIPFCQDCLEYVEGEEMTKSDVYQAYVEWCENQGFYLQSQSRLSKQIKAHFPLVTQRRDANSHFWENVSLFTSQDEENQTDTVTFES